MRTASRYFFNKNSLKQFKHTWSGVKKQVSEKPIELSLIGLQVIILFQQTQILKQQNNLQRETREEQRRIQWSADGSELRNAIWELLEQFPSHGINDMNAWSVDRKTDWLKKTRRLLDSQAGNPVLIENTKCLGHWRNAGAAVRIATVFGTPDDKDFVDLASHIFHDVMEVKMTIALDSPEVAAKIRKEKLGGY